MSDWSEAIFAADHHLGIGAKCVRAVIIFFFGLLLIRLAGRRIFGKWSALDIVVSIMAGSNLSRAITGTAPMVATMAATAVLVALHWAFAKWAVHSKTAARVLEGEAVELGRNGELYEDIMKQWSVSGRDLAESMRQSKVKSLSEMHEAILEPSGKINVSKASG